MDISKVNQYVGLPYKNMGRDRSGLDCWGLIKIVYKEILGIELWDIGEAYPDDWSFKGKDLFMENYQRQWENVDEPQAWDVVLLQNGGTVVNHAGIVLNKKTFIHCTKAGVALGGLRERPWRSYVAGFYRYKGKL